MPPDCSVVRVMCLGCSSMQVSTLLPREPVGLEFDRLERIWHQFGPEEGEIELGATMEDLAGLLHESLLAWEMSDLAALRMRALMIQGIGDRLGMALVSHVAGDVIALCGDRDDAALAATVARLCRVGEQSLIAIWDAQVPV